MQYLRSAAVRLSFLGLLLLAILLGSLGATVWIGRTLDGGAAAVNETGRLRMQTWRIAALLQAEELVDGQRRVSPEVLSLARSFDDKLAQLVSGSAARPLSVPADPYVQQRLMNVVTGWQALRRDWIDSPLPPAAHAAAQAEMFVAMVDDLTASIEQQLNSQTTLLSAAQTLIIVFALGGAALLVVAGHRAVGDLRGALQSRLREALAGLDMRRQRMAALQDVSAFVASAHTVDDLAQGFVTRIRRLAGADAAAVRWAEGATALPHRLLAGDNLPPGMADGDKCLADNDCLCGHPELALPTRVVPIRSDGAARDHCARAGLRTLVMVPVRRQGRAVGEIDLFYRDQRVLDDDERQALDLLADQLACALDGWQHLPAADPARRVRSNPAYIPRAA